MADLTATVTPCRAEGTVSWSQIDQGLLIALGAIALLGVIMVASASVSVAEQATGDAFYYLKRQAVFIVLACGVAFATVQVPLVNWERGGPALLVLALALLAVVLIPGVGREVNGAVRWIPLGVFNFQVAEGAKVLLMLYLAGYLVRRGRQVRESSVAFLVPVALFGLCGFLLLLQPDFGTALLLLAVALGMLFLAGVPLWRFMALVAVLGASAAALVVYSPYRWQRVTAFMDPWSDPFATGFQLTQSLIAIGRGEWWGVGLGNSVQKLFYLPEAHTDFVFSVMAEEFGLLGVAVVVALFAYVTYRALLLGRDCHRHGLRFAGYAAWGAGLSLGLQAFINMGVAMGILPTKGLTLPLISYGGSSALATGVVVGLLLRAGCELRQAREAGRRPEEADS